MIATGNRTDGDFNISNGARVPRVNSFFINFSLMEFLARFFTLLFQFTATGYSVQYWMESTSMSFLLLILGFKPPFLALIFHCGTFMIFLIWCHLQYCYLCWWYHSILLHVLKILISSLSCLFNFNLNFDNLNTGETGLVPFDRSVAITVLLVYMCPVKNVFYSSKCNLLYSPITNTNDNPKIFIFLLT